MMISLILILINSVTAEFSNDPVAIARTTYEPAATVYPIGTHQTSSIQLIKSFLSELSANKSITNTFIYRYLYIDGQKKVDSTLIFALEQLKNHYETYRQNNFPDVQVQELKEIELDIKKDFYFVNLTEGHTLNFWIEQDKISSIFTYIEHEYSTLIFYSGITD